MTASANGSERFDAIFASDVHLSSDHPATTDAFLRFVDDVVAGRTERFYLLGDLFEYWAGDDDLDDPLALQVVERLRALSDGGVAVAFMAGNRDFLIGDAFASAAGLAVLADPSLVRIGDIDVLLSHGDALCVDDVDYQRFRAMVRQPEWQRHFLDKPLPERREMIVGVRRQSEAAKQAKAAEIMDVNADAVTTLLVGHPDAILIHGHTHRPTRHALEIAGGARERWVLTDWDAEASPPRGGGLALLDGSIVEVG